jgi:hypothetical protein
MAAMQLLESRAAAFETQGVLIFFETQGVPWLLLDNYNNIINSTLLALLVNLIIRRLEFLPMLIQEEDNPGNPTHQRMTWLIRLKSRLNSNFGTHFWRRWSSSFVISQPSSWASPFLSDCYNK